ncbi:hypothetical protein [Pseudomonas tolaasii]|uniref:hypothetical protein n=1 Tax=Pseudomonas tolaasii TaxID=29442 RepID=UPI0004CE6AD6|nr:hypothetical protein [Pseudomonas tolaasii]
MNTQKNNLESDGSGSWDMPLRAASLLSIMLGALIFGAGANPLAMANIPLSIAAGAAVFISFVGVYRGGIGGMLIFALGHALLGSALFGGMISPWLYALAVPIAVPGIAYRILSPA